MHHHFFQKREKIISKDSKVIFEQVWESQQKVTRKNILVFIHKEKITSNMNIPIVSKMYFTIIEKGLRNEIEDQLEEVLIPRKIKQNWPLYLGFYTTYKFRCSLIFKLFECDILIPSTTSNTFRILFGEGWSYKKHWNDLQRDLLKENYNWKIAETY